MKLKHLRRGCQLEWHTKVKNAVPRWCPACKGWLKKGTYEVLEK